MFLQTSILAMAPLLQSKPWQLVSLMVLNFKIYTHMWFQRW